MKLACLLLVLSGISAVVGMDGGPGRPGAPLGRGRLAVLLLVVHLLSQPVFAVGARPLGMGRAYLGISDDENAVYFNVAGLSQLDKELNQASAQVIDRQDLRRDSICHVGKIYQSTDKKKLTLEEYLESDYNFKAEVQKVSNYAWGVAFSSEKRSLDLNLRSGFDPASEDRKETYWAGFSTRFPVMERLTRRPELYAALRFRFDNVDRKIPALESAVTQEVFSTDVHVFYRANSRFNLGLVLDSVISSTTKSNMGASPYATTLSVGGAYYYGEKRDTILACDFTNIFDAKRGVLTPKVRLGAERQFLDNDFVFRIGSDDGLLTLGVGVRFWEDFRLDYSFERGTVIDDHTVSVRLVF